MRYMPLWRCGPPGAMASSFLRFLDHTHDAPQSVRLLWTSDQLVTGTSTWQHTTLTTHLYLTTHNTHNRPLPDNTQHSQQTSTWQHTTLTTDVYLETHNTDNRPLPDNTQHSQQTSAWQHITLTTHLYLTTHNTQHSQHTSTWQYTTLTTDEHLCPGRHSNPQSHQGSGSRPTP